MNLFKTGLSFGLTSAVITTLGLIVGLYSGTDSKSVVLGGILIIAIADAFSDSLGIHLAEESKPGKTQKEVWFSTISAFVSKFFITATFIIPFLIFDIRAAIITGALWGYFLLTSLSIFISRQRKEKLLRPVSEHLLIATLVIVLTHYTGIWIKGFFA